MKIAAFNDTADLIIVDPFSGEDLVHDDGKTVSITLYGKHTSQYIEEQNRILDKNIDRSKQPSAAASRADALNLMVACTKSLNNFKDVDFGDGPVDDANPRKLYSAYPWLKDQVDAGIAKATLFRKGSPKPKTS